MIEDYFEFRKIKYEKEKSVMNNLYYADFLVMRSNDLKPLVVEINGF